MIMNMHSYIQNEKYILKLMMYLFSLCIGAYCTDDTFGQGDIGYKAAVPCEPNKVGEITAVCKENRKFDDVEDNCILLPVQELLDQSQVT